MRNIIIAAAAALSLVACRTRQEAVSEKRAEVAREQVKVDQKAADARAEADRKSAQAQLEADRKIADDKKDLREDQRDLAQQQRQLDDGRGVGGAGSQGMAATTVSGTITSTFGPQIVMLDKLGGELKLKTDDHTLVTSGGQRVDIDDFKKGTEVRATYFLKGDDRIAQSVEILKPIR